MDEANKYYEVKFSLIIFAIGLVGLATGSAIRYLIHIVPFCIIFESLLSKKISLNIKGFALFVIYLFCNILYFVFASYVSNKEIIFISIIILTASINFNVPKDSIFWLLIISGVLLFTIERENISSQTSFFTQSTGITEHSLGLSTGLMAIFFYHNKHWKLFILAIVISYFYYKRIVYVGIFVVLFINAISYKSLTLRKYAYGILSLLIITVGLNSESFYELISSILSNYLGQYVSPNLITSGRYYMVTEINNILENASTLSNIFGNGSGFSHIFTSTDQASNASQLHNDILRIRIDYGYIGIFGLIIIILNALTKNKFYMSIFFYSLTLLLTDNILTYTYYWITFFILVSAQRKFELLNTTRDKN